MEVEAGNVFFLLYLLPFSYESSVKFVRLEISCGLLVFLLFFTRSVISHIDWGVERNILIRVGKPFPIKHVLNP